ncbi:MAG: hypothetical protein KC550_04720 [Nanoarchaeota archaeon]|nr:hypothetical protein [Nanoarchaeota archaeon]
MKLNLFLIKILFFLSIHNLIALDIIGEYEKIKGLKEPDKIKIINIVKLKNNTYLLKCSKYDGKKTVLKGELESNVLTVKAPFGVEYYLTFEGNKIEVCDNTGDCSSIYNKK